MKIGVRRTPTAWLLLLAVVVWQSLIFMHSDRIPETYQIHASEGLAHKFVLRYFYFYHHFGVFPVAAIGVPEHVPAGMAADEVVRRVGRFLRNDVLDNRGIGTMGDYA